MGFTHWSNFYFYRTINKEGYSKEQSHSKPNNEDTPKVITKGINHFNLEDEPKNSNDNKVQTDAYLSEDQKSISIHYDSEDNKSIRKRCICYC